MSPSPAYGKSVREPSAVGVKQVESLIGEGSPKLEKEYNVSPARIESLRSVIADPYRENEEGETVAVRQKPQEDHCRGTR